MKTMLSCLFRSAPATSHAPAARRAPFAIEALEDRLALVANISGHTLQINEIMEVSHTAVNVPVNVSETLTISAVTRTPWMDFQSGANSFIPGPGGQVYSVL